MKNKIAQDDNVEQLTADKWFVSIVLRPQKLSMVFDNELDATNFYNAASGRYQGAEIDIGRKRRIVTRD